MVCEAAGVLCSELRIVAEAVRRMTRTCHKSDYMYAIQNIAVYIVFNKVDRVANNRRGNVEEIFIKWCVCFACVAH